MLIKKIGAKIVRDSRNEKTILVIIKTSKGEFKTSAPSGKSTGKYEVKPYNKNLVHDIDYINKLDINKINNLKLKRFKDLKILENFIGRRLGGNSLFVLEASLLKAIAGENKQELSKFLNNKANKNNRIKIISVGNAIGGGLHSKGVNDKKPNFQEFLIIGNGKNFEENVKINEICYNFARKLLNAKNRNDEGAWETGWTDEIVLKIIKKIQNIMKAHGIKVDIGIDIAASSFFNIYSKKYNYKNLKKELNSKEQINYISQLIKKYSLLYVEDPLNENDFSGFRELLKKVKKFNKNCLVVGDDLTATNPSRLKFAIKNRSINAIIIKPNQIGSLLKVKEVIDLAKKNKIKTIISHRSGENLDDTIASLAIAWNCNFIKTGIYGKVREVKLKRLIEIEKSLKR